MPRLDVVRHPYALPPAPDEPFTMLDVAFAGGNAIDQTHAFIAAAGDRLRLWVDHHEHALGWPRYQDDSRFVLVSSRLAHACPELVTPEVVARAGSVGAVLAHHDFDGLMSAVKFLLGGREPYEGADEDARASDSPGRGHVSTPRGRRLSMALSEAVGQLDDAQFLAFYRSVADSLVTGKEAPTLAVAIDGYVREAEDVVRRAESLATARRVEAPGVCVLRLEAKLDGRLRLAVLSILEREATVGLVLEGTPKRYWATAATYSDQVALEEITELDRGRHDLRFGSTKDAVKLIEHLSRLVRRVGLA